MKSQSSSISMGQLLPFFALLKAHWGWMLCGLLLAVISTLANIALLAFSGWFLASMALAGMVGASINYFTPAAIIRFLALVRAAGRYAERLVTHNATFKLLSDLRVSVFSMLESVMPSRDKKFRSGELLNRVQSDVEILDHLYLGVLLPAVTAMICAPILIAIMGWFEPTLAILLTVGLMLVGIGLPVIAHKWSQSAGQQERDLNQTLRTDLVDTLDGYKELAIFGGLAPQAQHFDQLNHAYCRSQLQQQNTNALSVGLTGLFVNLSVLLTLVVILPQVVDGSRVGSHLPMLCLLMLASFEAVQGLPLAFAKLSQCLRSADNILSLGKLDVAAAKQRLCDSNVGTQTEDSRATNAGSLPSSQAIEFNQVSFSYAQQDSNPTLSGINLSIQRGERVAILGPSGAGKSTLCHLINKVWESDTGEITVHEQTLKHWPTDSLRNHVSTLSQTSYVFMGTIRDNLRMAAPNANEQDMFNALELAGLKTMVEGLEQGLDTWVGDTGRGLSGGESRRLSLAQVVLRDTPVLLLDEPTEGLDNLNKRQITERLINYLDDAKSQEKDKALLLITHDETQTSIADRVLWLEQGHLGDKTSA